jgi:mRNA-degrading endonuclease RelE of RelBE toxin-antitoxin system
VLSFGFARSFERSLKGLHPPEKVAIQRQVDSFMLAMDVRRVPTGFGIKKMGGDLWEFRTDLAIRILFSWEESVITFLFVGNHNEVQQFLRHYR